MDNIRIILSFIIPLIFIFVMVKIKANASFFMIISAIMAGVIAGMPLSQIISTVKTAFGSVLSTVGLLLLFGVIFSEYLEQSGGITRLASYIAKKTTPNSSIVAIYLLGYVISIPVNWTAACTMLVPLIKKISDRTGKPIQAYACAFSSASFATNCLVVPTLTPALVAGMAGIAIGSFMGIGIVVSFIGTLVGGLLIAFILAKKYGNIEKCDAKPVEIFGEDIDDAKYPPVGLVIFLIILPIILILMGTFVPDLFVEGFLYELTTFIGEPSGALLITIIVEMFMLKDYLPKNDSMKVFADGALHCGPLLILTGCGNAFGAVLTECGLGTLIADVISNAHIPVLLIAFILVAILRAGTGSMISAAIMAVPLLLPVAESSAVSPTLLCIAICAGCLALIIPSSTEFWIMKDTYGISVKDMLISITMPTTVVAIVSIIITLVIGAVFPTIGM